MEFINKQLDFDDASENDFERLFLQIIDDGTKDSTYKFAFTRFLLDYSKDNTEKHVSFLTIAEYFLKYYWPQACKVKMMHTTRVGKNLGIIKIIENEFTESYYRQTYDEIKEQEPEKIKRCVKQIRKNCFHNVTWRFQNIKGKRTARCKLFFDYNIKTENEYSKKVDLDYGILINPNAMQFFKRHYALLLKATVLEWARFLERFNDKLPNIIRNTEGDWNTKHASDVKRIYDEPATSDELDINLKHDRLQEIRQSIQTKLKDEPAMLNLFSVLDQDISKLDKARLQVIIDRLGYT